MRSLVVIATLLLPAGSWACSYMPPSLFESDEILVDGADAIVMARVVGFEPEVHRPASQPRMAVFHFESVQVLKGEPPPRFDLQGFLATEGRDHRGDFEAHSMPEFWARHAANSGMPGDCNAYGMFSEGETYLIFLRKHSHLRAFENIRSEEDLWLKVVRLLVAARSRTSASR